MRAERTAGMQAMYPNLVPDYPLVLGLQAQQIVSWRTCNTACFNKVQCEWPLLTCCVRCICP